MPIRSNRSKFLLTAGILTIAALPFVAASEVEAREMQPSVIITQDDLPPGLRSKIYSKPVKVREIRPSDIMPQNYSTSDTLVARKIEALGDDLFKVQGDLSSLSGRLSSLQHNGKDIAVKYYANIATINTQLQSGTTPGNPRLIRKLEEAERSMEALSANVTSLNELAVDAAHVSSEAAFLLEEARATYGISGAVEEDHVALAKMEDNVNNTMVLIDRLLNTVNDDITRTSAYLNSERKNLRTLSLAVANGDLYGKNLAMRPFSSAPVYNNAGAAPVSVAPSQSSMPAVAPVAVLEEDSAPVQVPSPTVGLSGPRPLAKIKFDKQDVDYEQPVYMAVSQALEKYPNSTFDLVAVHPSAGNAAQKAIESTRSRRNAERVLRTLTQMGLPLERINLSYNESAEAQTNEVHLYVR